MSTRRKKKSFDDAMMGLVGFIIGTDLRRKYEARKAEEKLMIAEKRAALLEAQTKIALARAEQVPEQTEGIIRRYLMTTENTENAIIRQRKQELEIARLKLQIKQLELELGILPKGMEFNPERWEK